MSFLYSIFLKLLYPTSVGILLLLTSAILRRATSGRPGSQRSTRYAQLSRISFWSALAVLLVCGNGWVVKYSTRYLERQYPPLTSQLSTNNSQLPTGAQADCILVLGGGTWDKIPPRPTVEVGEAGDRILYAVHLFREGRSPRILCTSGIGTGGIGPRPASAAMAELLENLGVPESAIIRENASRNTHEHGKNLQPMLEDKGFKRIFLVTSALHMPRAMGVFKKQCPGIEFIPAPTDFRIVGMDQPWYRELVNLIPTPSSYLQFSETLHEYLGMAYYRMRGWM